MKPQTQKKGDRQRTPRSPFGLPTKRPRPTPPPPPPTLTAAMGGVLMGSSLARSLLLLTAEVLAPLALMASLRLRLL